MGKILDEAIFFATKAHAGQFRKSTQIPYILHPSQMGQGQIYCKQKSTEKLGAFGLAVVHYEFEEVGVHHFEGYCVP